MTAERFVREMPIDDVMALLDFYNNYNWKSDSIQELKEMPQKNNKLSFYYNGKNYTLYSDNAIYMYHLMTKPEPEPHLVERIKERLKEMLVGRETDKKSILSSIVGELKKE